MKALISIAILFPILALAENRFSISPEYQIEQTLRQSSDIENLRAFIGYKTALDISNLCKEMRLRESSVTLLEQGRNDDYKKLQSYLDKGELLAAELLLAKEARFKHPWGASLTGSGAAKLRGILYSSVLSNQWGFKTNADVLHYLQNPENSTAREPQFSDYQSTSIFPLGRDLTLDWFAEGTCKEITGQSKQCASNLKEIAVSMETFRAIFTFTHPDRERYKSAEEAKFLMAPVLTAKDVHDRVLKEPQYQEGIRRAAIKILARGSDDVISPSTNLFDDVKAGFLEAGTKSESVDGLTWDVMAVLAAGGPNVGQRLWTYKTDPVNNTTRIALTAIAEIIPLYDSIKLETQKSHYSLPPGVNSTCDSGKSYHFWMTAYLARKAALASKNPSAAASAAYISNVAYQALAGGVGWRSPGQVFQNERFGPIENGIRMDLSLAAAGAKYGAYQEPTNVDKVYRSAIQQTTTKDSLNSILGTLIWLNPGAAKRRWEQIYTPWSIFKDAGSAPSE
jgi:hypothetical protein